MWSLFQSYNLPIDEFEAQLSAASFEAGDDFISRATNTARVLILFKKCLRNSIQPSFVAPGLELVAEKWRECYASTASDCGMDPTIFEVPDLPYDTLQKIRLIAPARYKEHPFEQYQRLFILLKHTEANLHPRKWFTENYDPLNRRFRSENWTFSPSDFLNPPPGRLTARDQPLAAPLWMRGELSLQYLKSTHSLELDAIKELQKYRHEAIQSDVAASDLQEDGEKTAYEGSQEDGEDTVDIASQSNVVTSELQDSELQEDGEETVYEGSQEDGEDAVFLDDHTDDNGMIWALPRD
ncbi:hypothetical protein E8E14_006016 [Neopestalotiopsis sp. 37M]|nr:hypothetical protein E8E14_006016 [Neopestalotiopsis sp. 37M]